MMKLKVGEKEYQLKFGYKATLKSRILSRMAKIEDSGKNEGLESLEDLLVFIPDVLLVALQKFHKDEFGFDVETGEGKEEMLGKAFELVEDYVDQDGDVSELYNSLTEELKSDSFLSKLFEEEKASEKKTKETSKEQDEEKTEN